MIMLIFLLSVGMLLLLAWEGYLCASRFFPILVRVERLACSLSLAALINVLLVFAFMILHIPLRAWSLLPAHGIIVIIFLLLQAKNASLSSTFPLDSTVLRTTHPLVRFFLIVAVWILCSRGIFAFTHAVLLPSFYYDTVSQWNMRSQLSFYDGAIAFDPDENRGMSKPQYPILLHAWQITGMRLSPVFSDRIANFLTLLLTVSGFCLLNFLLRRSIGSVGSLLSLGAILSIPLLAMHLAQGYGDIHVITFLLLSGAALALYCREQNRQWLLLSALMVALSAWVKQEGVFFGVLPWMAIVFSLSFLSTYDRREVLRFGIFPAGLGLLWSMYMFIRGMELTPHGSSVLQFHTEALYPLWDGLLTFGSFGVWMVILILLSIVGLRELYSLRKSMTADNTHHILSPFVRPPSFAFGCGRARQGDKIIVLILGAWSMLCLIGTFFIFLGTSNVAFLINHQTFSRTMLIPLTLGILAISFLADSLYLRWEPLQKCHGESAES